MIGWLIHNKQERMWKEAVVAYARYGNTEEKQKILG
jgi:hypothetical protein